MVPPTGDKTAETSERAAGRARMSENIFTRALLSRVSSHI